MTTLRKKQYKTREDTVVNSPLTDPSSSDWTTLARAIGSELSEIPGKIFTYWPTLIVFTLIDLGEHVFRDAITMPETLYANRAVDGLIKATREVATLGAYTQ